MQIQAVNTPVFQGKRDNIDAIISMDDNTIRQIAYMQTASKIDEKKNRKVTNALFYSAPLAVGLSNAILSKNGNTRIFSKNITGLAGRMAKGLKIAAIWTAALGAIDLLGFGKRKLAENSSEVRKFDREHPFLSFATIIAAGIGAITLVNKGAGRLAKVKAPKFMQNLTGKAEKFINKNGVITSIKKGISNLAQKTPSSLKDFGETLLSWSPTALLFGGLFHSIASSNAESREFAKNYTALKERQTNLSRARVRELAMQNDFLMQDAHNREDIALLKAPLKDLQDEAVD